MLRSRCVIPLVALYLLLEEAPAAALPSGLRDKREVDRADQELFPRLPERSDRGDLSVGDAAAGTGWDADGRPSHSETALPVQRQSQNQHKAAEKRRKLAPLDSIGGFQLSSLRNRKGELASTGKKTASK